MKDKLEALAKGEDVSTTAGWKFDKEDLDYIRAVYSVHPMVWDVLDELIRLQSQLVEKQAEIAALDAHVSEWQACIATRDALIERLVEAGEKACCDYNGFGYCSDRALIKPKSLPLEFDPDEFEDIVEEYRASKDGGVE